MQLHFTADLSRGRRLAASALLLAIDVALWAYTFATAALAIGALR